MQWQTIGFQFTGVMLMAAMILMAMRMFWAIAQKMYVADCKEKGARVSRKGFLRFLMRGVEFEDDSIPN